MWIDTSLGIANIGIEEHTEALLRGQIFELNFQKNASTCGVLTVFVKMIPATHLPSILKPHQPFEYPLARIAMAEDVFLPNSIIQGFLILNLKKRTLVNRLHLSFEHTTNIEYPLSQTSAQETGISGFSFPHKIWRVSQDVGLNTIESDSTSSLTPSYIDTGSHVFAFELPLPKRLNSFFWTSQDSAKTQIVLATTIDNNTELVTRKGISIAHQPRFLPSAAKENENFFKPVLPPSRPEWIPSYAAQFIDGPTIPTIGLERLYDGDLSAAYGENSVENVKVDWSRDALDKAFNDQYTTFKLEASIFYDTGEIITDAFITAYRTIISFGSVPNTERFSTTKLLCHSRTLCTTGRLRPIDPIPPQVASGERKSQILTFSTSAEELRGAQGDTDYSSAIENCGEAYSIFWWLQLDVKFGNSDFKKISRLPIFYSPADFQPPVKDRKYDTPDEGCDYNSFEVAKIDDKSVWEKIAPRGIFRRDFSSEWMLGTFVQDDWPGQYACSSISHKNFKQMPKQRLFEDRRENKATVALTPYQLAHPDEILVVIDGMPKP